MDAETGFLIDGKVYEVPTIVSLTLDEDALMYAKCGLIQDDFVTLAEETKEEKSERLSVSMRHPGFMMALAQIAYQRGNPTMKPGRVELVIGKQNRNEAFSTLGDDEEEQDESPLASTSEPNETSPSDSLENEISTKDSTGTSGSDSGNGSDSPAGEVVSIGTTRSATSSTSGQGTSVASGPAT